MKLEGDGKLLRIFLGESDRVDGKMMYEAIVRTARESGLAGATVLRGIEGFGATEEKIMAFMPLVDELFRKSGGGGLITVEKAQVIHYTPGGASS